MNARLARRFLSFLKSGHDISEHDPQKVETMVWENLKGNESE
jgi:hypothetical protein